MVFDIFIFSSQSIKMKNEKFRIKREKKKTQNIVNSFRFVIFDNCYMQNKLTREDK